MESSEVPMFFRLKPAKGYRYLQIARSVRRGKTVRQEIIATLGRLDVLQESGQLDSLLRSGLRFARKVKVLDAHAAGETEPVSIAKIGPDLVVGRLWQAMGFAEIVGGLAAKRKHEFDLERAVYLTVLHRLFASGSDRAADVWKENYRIAGAEDIWLHQLYRTRLAGRRNRGRTEGIAPLHQGFDRRGALRPWAGSF